MRFTVLDSKPTLIGSKYALFSITYNLSIHPSTIRTKTYVSIRRKKLSRIFSVALFCSPAPLPL